MYRVLYIIISLAVFNNQLIGQLFEFHISIKSDTINHLEPVIIDIEIINKDEEIVKAYSCCTYYYKPTLLYKEKGTKAWQEVAESEVSLSFDYLKKHLVRDLQIEKPQVGGYESNFKYRSSIPYLLLANWKSNAKPDYLVEKTKEYSFKLQICPFFKDGKCINSNAVNIYVREDNEIDNNTSKYLKELSIPYFIFSPFYSKGFRSISTKEFSAREEAEKLIKIYPNGYLSDVTRYGIADDIFSGCMKSSNCNHEELLRAKSILIGIYKKYQNKNDSFIFKLNEVDYMILNINSLLGLPFNDGIDW